MDMGILVNGGLVDLDDLQEDDIQTVQVAKALSRIRRFSGNFQGISVAQHAVIVSTVIDGLGGTLLERMSGLHHDDAEAFVGDIPSLIKGQCPGFVDIENSILDIIDSKYMCKTRAPMVVHADKIVGNSELLFHIEMDGMLPRMMADIADTPEGNGICISNKMLLPWPDDEALGFYLDAHDKLIRLLAKEAKRAADMSKPKEPLGKEVN